MPQPLPPNPYKINTHSREYNAYGTCLKYEARAIAGSHPVVSGPQSVTLARLLGYMILHAPTELGRENISNEVMSCATPEALTEKAKLYMTALIHCCEYLTLPLSHNTYQPFHFYSTVVKSAKGPTSAPSSPHSGSSLDIISDTFLYTLEAPQDHRRAKKLVGLSNVCA